MTHGTIATTRPPIAGISPDGSDRYRVAFGRHFDRMAAMIVEMAGPTAERFVLDVHGDADAFTRELQKQPFTHTRTIRRTDPP